MKILIVLSLCCCYLAIAADPKAGLKCTTKGGFEYCEGKNTGYSAAVGTVQKNTVLANRVRPQGTSGPAYGFMPKEKCDAHDRDKCQQFSAVTSPTFLKNSKGHPRYIIQDSVITQRVQLAICSDNKCGRGRCQQQYATVKLLAWDPIVVRPQLIVDDFRIPSCCKCSALKFPGR